MADEERRNRQSFFSDLETFYRKKWNSQLKTPNFNGRPVDLYRLYKKVTTLGGWKKVSTLNKWNEVSEALNMPIKCYGVEHAVKMIYMRYLARYQQQQMFGEDLDDANDSGAGSSHRSSRSKHYLSSIVSNRAEGPNHLSSRGVHQITDIMRLSGGYSNDLIERGPYEKLIRSLQSGLANETDFALNSCLVMSSSSHNISLSSLRLNQASMLLDLLLAHVGFFEEGTGSYRVLYENGWKKEWNNLKFVEFWHESIEDDDIKELLTPAECRTKLTNASERRIFNLTQQFGAHNLVSQKILLIGNILRNFSFETEFKTTLASNRTMLKYLLVCINSKFANLQSLGWDALSNLSSELALDPFDSVLTQILFRTLNKSLNSSDKFCIIRALETIGGLCANEKNELLLCEFMEPCVIRRLIALLAVKDIMMCVHLLECLYSVSEMGQISCQRIAEQPKAIDTFISLVTVEAVSFGPSGLMGMKVVEFGMPQPHTAILPQPFRSGSVSTVSTAANSTSASNTVSNSVAGSIAKTATATPGITVSSTFASSSSSVPPPFMAKPVRPTITGAGAHPATTALSQQSSSLSLASINNASPSPNKSSTKSSTANQSETKRSSKKVKKEPKSTPVAVNKNTSTPPPSAPFRGPAVQVQQDQQAELIASNWLKQNCTACADSSVSRAELYAAYVQREGTSLGNMAISINTFATLIRKNFPSCQLRQTSNVNCKAPLMQIDGLKFMSSLLGESSSCSPANPPPTTVLSSSSKSPVATIVNSSIVTSQHPLTHQILSQRIQFSPGPTVCPTSPAHSGTNSPAVRSMISSCGGGGRVRSDSFGTADSYSLPATPDSVISATTNSSSLVGPKSPPSPRLTTTKKSKSKKKKELLLNCPSSTLPPTSTPPVGVCTGVNCQLEVCHPAQEAQAVIETGDNHEAMIIRIENSTNDTTETKKPTITTNNNHKPINGQIDSDTSPENSRQSSTDSLLQPPPPISIVVSLLNKKGIEKKPSLNLNGLIKPLAVTLHNSPLNNIVVPVVTQACVNNVSATSNVVTNAIDNNSRTQSPSPDMETMKLNLQQQQENIQQLLMTPPQNESSSLSLSTTIDDDILDSVNAVLLETMEERRLKEQLGELTPSGAKKKPKRKSPKKKSFVADVVNFDGLELKTEEIHFEDIHETPKKTPKKKPSKRKTPATIDVSTTALLNDDGPTPAKKKKKSKKQQKLENNLANNVDTPANQTFIQQTSFRPPLPPVHAANGPQTNQNQQQMHYVATIQQQGGTTAQIVVRVPPPAVGKLKYTCEWEGCDKTFDTCTMITYHVAKAHVLSDLTVTTCRWANCDKTPRLTWSLIAHMQDVHCNERILRAVAIRRYEISLTGQSNIPETKSPPPHPGYPPDAALAAIRRHALVALPKDVTEENEGPVTKSIRLASCLILRNLARYSSDGRRLLRKYEKILSYLAMSRLESSIALSQCLAELNSPSQSPHSRTVDDDGECEMNDR